MMEHAVVIVGGGPTGLMLAGELALAGVDVAIVERRPDQEIAGTRAGGLHARTIEVLDQRGIAHRFLAAGRIAQVASFSAEIPLDISDFPTRHPYGLALGQAHIERILAAWVAERRVTIYREREVTGFAQDASGVDVQLSDGPALRARYLVGCDGGRSVVRRQAGIDFAGWEPSVSYLIAEAEMIEPVLGLQRGARGVQGIGKHEDGRRVRVVLSEPEVRQGDEPTLDELRAALVAIYGRDFGVHGVTFLSRFTDAARQAVTYRDGRVLLAGDAAHVHSPAGGQGLNIGVQDAVNLGWKLARVVREVSPESLLDTYHAERHPIAARVLKTTLALTALNRGDDRTTALREMFADALKLEAPRKRYAAQMSGLDICYDLGDGHPQLGRRMPDLDVVAANGPVRVFALLHEARAVLLDFAGTLASAHGARRVDYRGAWELPVLGAVPAPAAALIRPDGHVAWVGDGSDRGLADALAMWGGP